MSEYADLPKETDLVVEQVLFDDLAVLPACDRAEFQLERSSGCVVNLAVETLPWAYHLSFPFGDRAGPIAGTKHHAEGSVVEMILNGLEERLRLSMMRIPTMRRVRLTV